MAHIPTSRHPEPAEPEDDGAAAAAGAPGAETPFPDMPVGNRLLAALPADEYAQLALHLEGFESPHQYVFYEPDVPISHVYFPASGVASLLMLGQGGERSHGGAAVEIATVGNEGMVGIPVFLGQDSTPGRALMQVPGAVLRMPVEDFRRQVVDVPGSRLQLLLQHYTHALMVQMAQGLACNRLHTIEQRAARWLLTTRDRVGGPTFPLKQEFLAQMLGVRRAGVSAVASALQEQSLITYSRGVITIRDPAGLAARACDCYRIISGVFDRMLAGLQEG